MKSMESILDETRPEPFRINMVQGIKSHPRDVTKEIRQRLIEKAGYNVFRLKSEDVFIDLLTDSGMTAMSDKQWAAKLTTQQAYAGSNGYYFLKKVVKEIFGFKYFMPVHQGRSAEHILSENIILTKGSIVTNNSHFDTTEANIIHVGGKPINFVVEEAYDTEKNIPFKGNMDIDKLEEFVRNNSPKIPLIMTTITNNTVGGQPVSMENIRQTSEVAKKYGKPFFIDACRFAENAYFIQQRERGYRNKSIKEIEREMFSYADGCTFSGKKEALTNIGGILATNDKKLFEKFRTLLTIVEGFETYGGLSCGQLAAMSVGLREAVNQRYLEYRIGQVNYLWKILKNSKIPVVEPAGGHAVFINGAKFFPHIPMEQFPSQTLVVKLYEEAGVRGVELGTSCFGKDDPNTGRLILPKLDLTRLAIPRRVYTDNHMEYTGETVKLIYEERDKIKGLERVYVPKELGHFYARFRPIN